jgi:hypothetical protein
LREQEQQKSRDQRLATLVVVAVEVVAGVLSRRLPSDPRTGSIPTIAYIIYTHSQTSFQILVAPKEKLPSQEFKWIKVTSSLILTCMYNIKMFTI